MPDEHLTRRSIDFQHQETFFRLINPEDYPAFGIDPEDVPMGTFASEDHPSFLPSRFGGNAYGLGLIEQSVLTTADTDFLESLDFQDVQEISRNRRRLNAIYQKLGLLMRFSHTGKRYFLIPINLVAHSLQEIKTKADEIEELIIRHIWETRTERLDIGLLTRGQDLIVHELTARLSSHRIFLFESLDKLRSWRLPLDILLLPKDLFEYLLEQPLPRRSKKPLSRYRLYHYAMYLAGKLYDIIEPTGKLLVLANAPDPEEDLTCRVSFKSREDLKFFLLFSHIFKTKRIYRSAPEQGEMEIHLADLHYFLNRFALLEPHIRRLLDHQKPEDLSLEEIDRLPRLNLRLPQTFVKNLEKQWKWIFEPYFTTSQLVKKSPTQHREYWEQRLEIDRELPESLYVFVGQPRQPEVTPASIEEAVRSSGMQGCSLSLVAEYRNSFDYVLEVLKILAQIRDHDFPKLSELERTRLSNAFHNRNENFNAVIKLLNQVPRLERIREILNPENIEGPRTPILENLSKLFLHGFTAAQLKEMLLIMVGYSTMSRIVFGKLPEKTLRSITDRAREDNYREIVDLLRVCRLMSMAEIAATLGESFTGEQAKELYRLYDDAIYVATDPRLDWERLEDLRISALGGVQNKAIREMLKLFNLFEFLDTWQDFMRRGPSQKEVICDYQPERLRHLQEALELAGIANDFKQKFMSDHIFGHSHFFRRFLDTEFHGTGHLFPMLGTRAGFILLWIAVNASDRHIINFNPLLAGVPENRREQRIGKIREALLRLSVENLQPSLFADVKQDLNEGRPAFIFDTGLRITSQEEQRVIEVSFVDVDENIRQLEALLTRFESQRLRGVSLRNLQELERLFSELESFHHYLQQRGCQLQCDRFNLSEGFEKKDLEIGGIRERLKSNLQGQIFVPEEVYDSISVLAQHCPEVLRFILPEFHAFGSLVETWPTRRQQSLGRYVMRCLEKFQALIIKDRNTFQDRNTFYQLAKQEFGPLAEEGIGATHAQMEILEYITERIQERMNLCQALNLSLVFQDIGKVDAYRASLPELADSWTHAEVGAEILEKSDILRRLPFGSQVDQLVIRLVRDHGVVGHVIQGEEPIIALKPLIETGDDRFLDALALHSIVAAAAVQEGLLTSDLLDLFLNYRALALRLLRAKTDWHSWLREHIREKGETVLEEFRLTSRRVGDSAARPIPTCGWEQTESCDEVLWHGRQSVAMERLFRLVGVTWVDYQDLQMHLLEMPVNFIYHKKKLKSVGVEAFQRQLADAAQMYRVVSEMTPELRCYLLFSLDHLGGALRIYHFHHLPRYLEIREAVKLLVITLQVFHHHYGIEARNGLISFGELSQKIEKRQNLIQEMLRELPFPERCLMEPGPQLLTHPHGRIRFQKGLHQVALAVGYEDAIRLRDMADSLEAFSSHDDLVRHYREMVQGLERDMPYETSDAREELRRVFERQRERINERILGTYRERMGNIHTFSRFQQIQDEIQASQWVLNLTERQRFLLHEMVEFHRSRLREHYLDSIYREIRAFEEKSDLTAYWDRLKHELYSLRPSVGKEFESLVAQFMDRRLEELS